MKKLSFARYGSLATHRGFLGLEPRHFPLKPFPCAPGAVFAKQVNGLVRRLKAIRARDVVIGISGGLDSALALLVAVEAFGRMRIPLSGIHAVTMPGFGTTRRTKGNAGLLCQGLGVDLETLSIAAASRRHLKAIGHDAVTPDTTYENAQARIRTLVLMNKANMYGGIVVGTGDMSESALGWCTFNGDHMSMFSVNAGVPKTVVRKVCAWWASKNENGIRSMASTALKDIIATPVSPELVKGQVTEKTVGPYELHDFFLWNFIVNEMDPETLLEASLSYFGTAYTRAETEATLKIFMRRFFTQAFKRNCQPDSVKVFPFDLSPHGWFIPSELGPVKWKRRKRS